METGQESIGIVIDDKDVKITIQEVMANFDKLNKKIEEVGRGMDKYMGSIGQQTTTYSKAVQQAKKDTENLSTANTNLLSTITKIGATFAGGLGIKELAQRIISVRADFESMETSLKVLLGGSQERLNNIMAQIKEYALASPLNTKDMVGAVQMMTSFGIEAEKSISYLKAMGDISMGDTGKFNSLALAFSQMSSAGKLMGQDLLKCVA